MPRNRFFQFQRSTKWKSGPQIEAGDRENRVDWEPSAHLSKNAALWADLRFARQMDAACLNLRQFAAGTALLAINRFFTQPNCKPGIMRYDADSLHPRAALELLLIRDFWGGIDFSDRLSGAPTRLLVMLERPAPAIGNSIVLSISFWTIRKKGDCCEAERSVGVVP